LCDAFETEINNDQKISTAIERETANATSAPAFSLVRSLTVGGDGDLAARAG